MKKENIYTELTASSKLLLNLARDLSFSYISDNCLYIITKISDNAKNFHDRNKIRLKENSLKVPKSLSQILPDLEALYSNFYDVNLYIYKADKQVTIIEIQYYPRSSLEMEYNEKTEFQESMLHCKVSLPAYHIDTKEKFDINWEFEPLNHRWKMFWWKRKIKNQIKNRWPRGYRP